MVKLSYKRHLELAESMRDSETGVFVKFFSIRTGESSWRHPLARYEWNVYAKGSGHQIGTALTLKRAKKKVAKIYPDFPYF